MFMDGWDRLFSLQSFPTLQSATSSGDLCFFSRSLLRSAGSCLFCRERQTFSETYLISPVFFYTAENEPSTSCLEVNNLGVQIGSCPGHAGTGFRRAVPLHMGWQAFPRVLPTCLPRRSSFRHYRPVPVCDSNEANDRFVRRCRRGHFACSGQDCDLDLASFACRRWVALPSSDGHALEPVRSRRKAVAVRRGSERPGPRRRAARRPAMFFELFFNSELERNFLLASNI